MSTRQMDPLETSLRQVDPANLSATGLDIPPLGLDEHEATETYVGRVVDLSLLKQALKRRRRLWASLALLGAAIGAAFPLVVPSQYQGVSNIYLTEPSGPASQAEMADDLSLLQTLAVAAKAVSLLHLHQSPVSFAQTYTGTPLSDVILQIQLSAPTQAEAVAYTNGLAKAFLDVRSSQVTYQTQLGVNALNSQVQGLNNAIASLSSQIDQLSARAANTASSSQLTQLIDSRSNDYGEVSQLQTQVQADLQAEITVTKGSFVLDAATSPEVHTKRIVAIDALSGLLAGLGLGVGFVVLAAILSDRPRRRRDVASVLGVPVSLSTGGWPPTRLFRRMRWQRRLKKPDRDLAITVARLRAQLEALPGCALAVVPVEATEPAALACATLALTLATTGKRTVLVDMGEGRPLGHLFNTGGKAVARRGAVVQRQNLTLVVAPEDPAQTADMSLRRDAEAVVTLASVDPSIGADHLPFWANGSVVVVRAGKASATRLAGTVQLLRGAGLAPATAMLVGADREDESVGAVEEPVR